MALDSLPPWLSVSPQHFLEAAQGGFNTGLKIAETQNQAQQARERADLAAQENALRAWEEQQRMQYRVQELESERERRDLERQALADYRNQQLGIRSQELGLDEERLAELGRHNLALEDAASGRLDRPLRHFFPNGEAIEVSPDGSVKVLRPGSAKAINSLTPTASSSLLEKFSELSAANPELMDTRSALANRVREGIGLPPVKTVTNEPPSFNLLKPSTWSRKPSISVVPLESPAAGTNTMASPAASPFPEGQILKNKKDGKRYIVTNGVPVLIGE